MKVSIIVTTDDGNTFQGETELFAMTAHTTGQIKKNVSGTHKSSVSVVDLSSPLRPFMKKYGRDLGGPQKFALLLAHIAKGDTKKEVARATIQKHWRKMRGLLGEWNPAYTTRAKENAWVDSPKFGTYVLLPGWKGVFNG